MAAYPRVTVELESTSRRVDVISERIDVAIRVRFPPFEDTELVTRVLGDSPQRIVASPALIQGLIQPLRPADLSGLPSLSLGPLNREHIWQFEGPDHASVRISHKPRLVTDDMAQLLYAAVAGVGVVQLPTIVVDAAIASGDLVDVFPKWTTEVGITQAVFPSRRGLLPSVRTFIDFLANEYAAQTSPARPPNRNDAKLPPWVRVSRAPP